MATVSDRIENVLNEARMLLLGGQVLLGFSYRTCFEPGFDRINSSAQIAEVSGLGIITLGLGLLIWPATFHQITAQGRQTEAVESFTTGVLDWALLPLALGLALTLFPVVTALHLPYAAWIASAAGVFALAVWYGGLLNRDNLKNGKQAQHKRPNEPEAGQKGEDQDEESKLSDGIKKVLMECRMALPGAQAFLGFQFAIVFAQGFDGLPRSSQLIHFASLLATTVAIVLLIAPAAYHRLVEAGENTKRFHRVASRFLITALVFLAPGMAGDLQVVLRKITGSVTLANLISALLLLTFYFLWFGIPLWKQKTIKRAEQN